MHAFLLLTMLCDKHRKRNWLDNKRLMNDHKTYINRIAGITARKLVADSEDGEDGDDSEDSDQNIKL